MADSKNPSGLDGTQSVSALGLRWAALRGMLSSPLIMVDDQRGLREELVRELSTLEQDFVALQARNATEISAKIDVAKSAVRDGLQSGQSWLIGLLSSIQADLHATTAKNNSGSATSRPTPNLSRTDQPRTSGTSTPSEPETPPAA